MRHGRLHTFLFADLVGFTALAELNGDEAAAEVAIRFTEDASRLAREHGARVVKRLGDAVMIHSRDAADIELDSLGPQAFKNVGAPTAVYSVRDAGAAAQRAAVPVLPAPALV